MVISEKYRYVFIETPHTASTAIHAELCEFYAGESILRKHAFYEEFLRIATDDQKKYFVFASVRNPMDEAVSLYYKYKTNHKGRYTNDNSRLKASSGGSITKRNMARFNYIANTGAGFSEYFKRYYLLPYVAHINANREHLDYVIRFESLQQDFQQLLNRLGIEMIRELPVRNVTRNKNGNFAESFTPDIARRALWVFAPFLDEWEYETPANLAAQQSGFIAWASKLLYRVVERAKLFVWLRIRWGDGRLARLLRQLF